MMQGNAAAYPQLPSAAFPKRGTPSNPVLYDTNGAFSFSSYGPGFGAYSRLPLPPATASPAPVLNTSPFFGQVASGQAQSSPTVSSQRDAQKNLLVELGLAYSGLEGFDEAASVGQAQLGTQMQSQLKNLLDIAADTPRPLGSPTNSGYLSPQAWSCPASSPKARAASTRASELSRPGPEYRGPKLEPPDVPITLPFAMGLVHYFQHHRNVPLPARYLCRLLDDAEKILQERDKDGPVRKLALRTGVHRRPNEAESQLIIVGDLHGQLNDLLWIFFKVGMPSPTNWFLVNGDVCDRGENATEIWALLFAFMSLWPQSMYVHRGNHEDRLLNMDYNCGGFYDEVLRKYGRDTGAMIYEKFGRIFARLPLASVIDDKIFVVHGGLSRGAQGSFLKLLNSHRTRTAEVPSATPGASAADLAFIDAIWADPQDYPGNTQNPRGPGLSSFGPDVTERFLREHQLELVVRSHQVPPNNDGFFPHHNGKLFTVFSASNYCGLTGNSGAVLILKQEGGMEVVRYMAPSFEVLATVVMEAPEVVEETPAAVRRSRQLARQSTAGQVELREQVQAAQKEGERVQKLSENVFNRAMSLVIEKKAELFAYWEQCDTTPPRGFISKRDWEEGLKAILGEKFCWKTIGKNLRVKDGFTKDVDYHAFLGRFRVTVVGGPAEGQRWAEELLGRFYGRLLALKGDAGSLEELEGFLGGDDGQVSTNDALEAFRWVLGNYITEDQSRALLRTLAAHALPDPSPVGRPLGVFEFLSRLDICFRQQASLSASGAETRLEKASPWARTVLVRLGRLLWMEDAEGSPKAGSTRMLEVFRNFDQDGDGLLQRREFSKAVKQLIEDFREELPEMIRTEHATDEKIAELVDLVDISGDGLVNYLEFLHAFQPVDRTPGNGLRMDLMEQICLTIWKNKGSLQQSFVFLEEKEAERHPLMPGVAGRVSREGLRATLRSLNSSLEATQGVGVHGAPLTADQIDLLVDHAVFDANNTLDWRAFLASFQLVDMGATRELQAREARRVTGADGGLLASSPFGTDSSAQNSPTDSPV